MEFVDGAILRDRAEAEATLRRGRRAASSATTSPPRSPGSTPSTSTPPDSATSRATTATSSASCALAHPVRADAASTASTTAGSSKSVGDRWPPTIPAPAARLGRARRLPPRQHGARRATAACARSSTGRSARSATRSPTSDSCSCYWAEPADPTASLLGAAPTTAPGFATRDQVLDGVRARTRPRPQPRRLLSGVRLLEAGLHPPRRLRSLPRRRDRRRPGQRRGVSRRTSRCSRRGRKRHWRELMDDEIYDHIIFLADPELNEPVLVVALEGWIDAGLGASTAMGTLLDDDRHRGARDLRHRVLHRPARAPPDRAHRRRRHDRADVARDPVALRPRRRRRRHRSSSSGPSRTSTGATSSTSSPTPPGASTCASSSDSAPSPRRRPTPARCASSAPPPRPARTCWPRWAPSPASSRSRRHHLGAGARLRRGRTSTSSRCGRACRTTSPRCPTPRRRRRSSTDSRASRAHPRRQSRCAPRPRRPASASTSS